MNSDAVSSIESEAESDAQRDDLWSASFLGLVVTQMLGAVNDNIFRWFVIGIGKEQAATNIASVLMAGTACFVLPYILFAAHAGYLADRYSKRTVIVWCKWAEVAIMALGIVFVVTNSFWWLLATVFLMGAQSALYGPAKLGAVPEMLKMKHISAANGILGLGTVIAVAVGTFVGNSLSDWTDQGMTNIGLAAVILIGTALVGVGASLLIQPLPVANSNLKFPWSPIAAFHETIRNLRVLGEDRAILRVALGTAFFWSLASLAQMNIDQFAGEGGTTTQQQVGPLLIALVAGVAVGCVLAGYWSQGHVELGILPLGAAGMALSSLALSFVHGAIINPDETLNATYGITCALLFSLGVFAGLFEVPLAAFLQHRSDPRKRGVVLAASNFLTFSGCMVVAIMFMGMRWQIREGALQNIEAAQYVGSPEFETQLAAQVLAHQNEWEKGNGTRITIEQIDRFAATDDERRKAIAELLWVELSQRFKVQDLVDRSNQLARFPEDKQLAAAVFYQASGLPLLSSRFIFLFCGIATVPVLWYILRLLPQPTIRFFVWLASETCYRIRVYDRENLPVNGGALLVSNHVTYLDGILLLLTSSRPVRMFVWAGNFQSKWAREFAEWHGAIMIDNGPKGILKALRVGNAAIKNGELVCIFAEGGITRSGQVQGFKRGLMKLVQGTDAPVVPVFLDELWGSIFSFSGGKFFWKRPQGWRTPISIHFGKPIEAPYDVFKIRQAVQRLGSHAFAVRHDRVVPPVQSFIKACKKRLFARKVVDSTGVDLTGGKLLAGAMIMRRLLNRHVLADRHAEPMVGILLPPTGADVVVNAALALDRRTTVNLNYTVGNDVLNSCIRQAGVKHVLTSRKFMEKFDYKLDAEIVLLEDLKTKPTTLDKVACGAAAFLTPSRILNWRFGLNEIEPEDLVTIIFTSGSTGEPKGVMLTQSNIASNVQAVDQMGHLHSKDVMIGILPFFHSFGYTLTMWPVLALDIAGAFHFSPLDAKQIGQLTHKYAGTLMFSTPTFLRGFLRRVDPDLFRSLEVVIAGAEKLPHDLCDEFEQRFGVRPVEGYGATECSPLVSCNIPPSRSFDNFQPDRKEGTVGRPIPNVSARIVDLDSHEELASDQQGMLQILGPNVMLGYLHLPEKTAEVIQDDWYTTGDMAVIDEDGFICITGRISRFSKIGGEMVPHIQIEDALNTMLAPADDEKPRIAVSAAPCNRKGERLIVLYTEMDKSPEQLREALVARGLPNIFIPAQDAFYQVPELPLLGTGKLDLKAIKEMALLQASAHADR
ncbi:MFS transporter [Blastopirellula marina]|uniref:2-acyl-glycerophospho-ethanolamine acyltransferase n=1 Tax=Blastopirellula marina DSM 3645 TaxID=314230 RepID=A3ZU07_9BACT|nr:MFS transporter [Blastopirellula marina]EAQ80069.1 2-acyl-glycerophospho-ethanolamine acyltransferase [Blastopirellula marina DSM 3645]